MRNSRIITIILLVLIIAIFQVVQKRNALELAAATPSITATPFLATANTATPTPTVILTPTATATLTPTPTLSATATTLSETPTPTPPFTASPTQLPIVVEGMGNCTPITHYNPFMLPADHQNDIDWIATAIVDHLNSGGDPYRIVDTFRLLRRDAYLQYVDLEGDGTKELLLKITFFRESFASVVLGIIDCIQTEQFSWQEWIIGAEQPYNTIGINDIVDLNKDGMRDVVMSGIRWTDSSDHKCQVDVIVYWSRLKTSEILTSPFPPEPEYSCSGAVQVTDENKDGTYDINVFNSHVQPDSLAIFEQDSTTGHYTLRQIDATNVHYPVTIPSVPPELPPLYPSQPKESVYCPIIRPISEFWLVPTALSYDEMPLILDINDRTKGVIPQILTYLNSGGDPQELSIYLRRYRHGGDLRLKDFDGDGVDELIVSLRDQFDVYQRGVALFHCTRNGLYQFGGWLTEAGSSTIFAVDDFNHDGFSEILIENDDIFVTSHCQLKRYLWGWNGERLYWVLHQSEHGVECNTSFSIIDTDGDGYYEFEIKGRDDRGPWDWYRDATWIYKLEENKYELYSKVLAPPTDRVHLLEDANTALKNGDIQQTIILYEQAITDPTTSFQERIEELSSKLQDADLSERERENWQSNYQDLMEGEAYTIAFAHLRLVILHIVNRDVAQSDYWLREMKNHFPDGTMGSELRILGETFIENWQTTQNISLACTTTNEQYKEDYQEISWSGVIRNSTFYIGWSPICPFEE